MGIISWLVDKEKRFAWSLVGAVVGIISLLFAYLALQEKKAQVHFAVTSEANVLDIHTPVPELDIEFQGQNLQDRNLNLRIITVRIQNVGDVNILQSHYDQRSAWGFRVSPGRVIEARITGTNSDYLRQALSPHVQADSIELDKVILETNKYVSLEVLTVHNKNTDPGIHTFGKIAGVEQISVVRVEQDDDQSFWVTTFSAPLGSQAIRLLAYPFAFVIVMLIVGGLAAAMSTLLEKRRKQSRLKDLVPFQMDVMDAEEDSPYRDLFMRLYVDRGGGALLAAKALMNDHDELLASSVRRVKMADRRMKNRAERLSREDAAIVYDRSMHSALNDSTEVHVVRRLLKADAIKLDDDGSTTVNEDARVALNEVLKYLHARGKISSLPRMGQVNSD